MTCRICGHEHGDEVVHPDRFHFTPEYESIPLTAPVVAMVEHQGRLYVATSEGVYILNNGRLERLMFAEPTEGMLVEKI